MININIKKLTDQFMDKFDTKKAIDKLELEGQWFELAMNLAILVLDIFAFIILMEMGTMNPIEAIGFLAIANIVAILLVRAFDNPEDQDTEE